MRLDKTEDADSPVAFIFGIYLFDVARAHRQGLPCFAKDLIWLLVNAPQRVFGVIRLFVDIQDVFHPGNELGILFRRDAPVFIKMRMQSVVPQHASNGRYADRFFKDDFLIQEFQSPPAIPFRRSRACFCYDPGFIRTRDLKPRGVGVRVAQRSYSFRNSTRAELF